MILRFSWILLLLALAGCRAADPQGGEAGEVRDERAASGAPLLPGAGSGAAPAPLAPEAGQTSAAGEPGGARAVEAETATYVFAYSWPAEAGAIPELAALLARWLDQKRNTLAREAEQGQRVARENGFPFNKYSSATSWEVVADLPDWLSLSATHSVYTGGAHPNYGFETLVWDKINQRPLQPAAMFASPDALDAVLGADLCERLNEERARRRTEPGEDPGGGPFDQCVSVAQTSVQLRSRRGRRFDRVGILIAPYVAGPYGEGVYEFTFPVTEELLRAVRPQYRAAFAARK